MTEQANTIVETEWSYFYDTEKLSGESESLEISPNEEEKKRLCQRLDLVSIESLDVHVVVTRRRGEAAFNVKGALKANITQSCVVTLEPVVSEINEEFEGWYANPDDAVSIAKARHEKLSEKSHGELPVLEESDDPEQLVEGKIDLGELSTQYLSLAINPYPHAEGVTFDAVEDEVDEKDRAENPFAALKDWKDKLEG